MRGQPVFLAWGSELALHAPAVPQRSELEGRLHSAACSCTLGRPACAAQPQAGPHAGDTGGARRRRRPWPSLPSWRGRAGAADCGSPGEVSPRAAPCAVSRRDLCAGAGRAKVAPQPCRSSPAHAMHAVMAASRAVLHVGAGAGSLALPGRRAGPGGGPRGRAPGAAHHTTDATVCMPSRAPRYAIWPGYPPRKLGTVQCNGMLDACVSSL